jgi:hypothetical protein
MVIAPALDHMSATVFRTHWFFGDVAWGCLGGVQIHTCRPHESADVNRVQYTPSALYSPNNRTAILFSIGRRNFQSFADLVSDLSTCLS